MRLSVGDVLLLQGRRDDPLVMAGRDGRGVTLLPLALSTLIEEEAIPRYKEHILSYERIFGFRPSGTL